MKKVMVLAGVLAIVFLSARLEAVAKKGYVDSSGYLPEFDTSDSMKELEQSFVKATPLMKVFERAGRDLEKTLAEYEKNPSIELEGKLENQLSDYVAKIVGLMDNFSADRDKIKWALGDVEREVGKFCASLKGKVSHMEGMFKEQQKKIQKLKDELAKIASAAKADPDNKELRKQFRNQLRKLRLTERYSAGYAANKKSLQTWSNSLEKLHASVSNVKSQIETLLYALDEEKEILGSAVELRAGRARIAAMLNKGLLADGTSLADIGNRIKVLYESLNSFSELSRIMDTEMSEDSAVNKAVMEMAEATEEGGVLPFISDDKQLDAQIDFYSRR